jgi:hypothetical protein
MEVSKLTARLLTVKRKRPLLKDIPPAELENRIAGQLEQRRQFYCQADLTINGEGVDAEFLVKLIMQQFRQS